MLSSISTSPFNSPLFEQIINRSVKIINYFRPKILSMTGICAGIREKVTLGDILVADPCYEWGGGKWVEDDEDIYFRPAPYQHRLDESFKSIVNSIKKNKSFLEKIHSNYQGKKPLSAPSISIDAMASGSSVLQSSEIVNTIQKDHKNLIGLEMETYAIFSAAHLSNNPKPIPISFKSVCDYGDQLKNDKFHEYACYTSAHVFYEFLKELVVKGRI